MNLTKLPPFIVEKRFGSNSIKQLICREICIQSHSYLGNILVLIDDRNNQIFVYKKGWNINDNNRYVLQSDKVPTIERLLNGELKIKWIKHPKLNNEFNPDKVLETWDNCFYFKEENSLSCQPGLRIPQIGAIYSVLAHWKITDDIGTVVMPTGTGKTETMMSLLVANKCEKLLVTVPTDSLREQLSKKFLSLGVLEEFGVISNEVQYPIVGVIYERFSDKSELLEFIEQCNVIITTMSIVTGSDPEIQKEISKKCSHYFIDEAHHVKANSWNGFLQFFVPRKVVQFTATPFRNDGQRLDGKIIFNYPLKKAQEEGYFKKINFNPIWEYSSDKADERIADEAVAILKRDIERDYNHILMARCKDKQRADEIFAYYQKYCELNPVKIYSGINTTERKNIIDKILNKEAKIIVCVDMLGEGFDLPELKVAAFHDIKKSLPITLQLAGRFTRTKHDEKLGEATFVANLADIDAKEELEELYAQDADWNLLLPQLSTSQIEQEIEFEDFLSGFNSFEGRKISLQNIRPALSTVIYRNKDKRWNPHNFKKGIHLSNDDKLIYDVNSKENVLIIVTAIKRNIEWGNFKDIQNIEWNLIVAYLDTDNNLLFIHGSDKSSLYSDLARAIIGDRAEIVDKLDVFKAFHNINRVKLQNVGLKEFLGKNIRFRMSVGTDVEEALSLAEKQRAQKAFVYGIGYENGNKISLGCSYKGRIWTRLNGDLKQFTSWCKKISSKIINPIIDPNLLLRETLIPKLISNIPKKQAVWIDWNEQLYMEQETKIKFVFDEVGYDFYNFDLNMNIDCPMGNIQFSLISQPKIEVEFEMLLYEEGGVPNYEFRIIQSPYKNMKVMYGSRESNIIDFFTKYEPTIWFADGAALNGNEYVELKQMILPYPKQLIQCWNWDGVDIRKESQGVLPKIVDSIQYYVIQELMKGDYDIIYDDDNSGEIADVITIKELEKKIKIELYHLKYAKKGVVSKRIDNLYEVCGQAQKSIHWKHKDGNEFFEHLMRRETKFENGNSCSRLEKGDIQKLVYFSQITKRKYPVEYEIYIVQPGLCPDIATDDQLTLLGVADNYIKEFAAINMKVIGNENSK
ncbi:DEAD/DEAH box helicase [Pseudobacteroides cellulosolvens]|uniref:Type III restriction protein res subunit n=1 Tax=Pseudobacteroides cellulosolvens ATCC 35603 = DSM 2933 TaxID=398512 RepID=A0A0L6JUY7_9FIRM|nr:DEAD/DEAH box helicase family protein [Pseudobacteroides cellulosolvens]KNY29539.1 type III restriction protein res subunit [Pseudobacteroides cellulosolvens ATCC 35603 = DSM 2933]